MIRKVSVTVGSDKNAEQEREKISQADALKQIVTNAP